MQPWSISLLQPRWGAVTEFDSDRGIGTVIDRDHQTLPFHCTAIADGTRHVEVGTPVSFVVVPGHRGRLEARAITALPIERR